MFLKHVYYFNTRYNPHNKKTTNYYQDTIKYLETGITDLIIDIVNFFHRVCYQRAILMYYLETNSALVIIYGAGKMVRNYTK